MLLDQYGDDEFVAKMGAEAMQDVLSEMQLEKEAANLTRRCSKYKITN